LRVDGAAFSRLGRLRPLRLPGGDRAAREPWRMAAAGLALLGRAHEVSRRFAGEPAAGTVAAMLERGLNAPETSSLGRWFDAASGLLGVQRRMAFEGQAAMRLEGHAERHGEVAPDRSLFAISAGDELDLAPLLARLADGCDPGFGAALFHSTLAEAIDECTAREARREGLVAVACGGGCFLNALLARLLSRALRTRGVAMLQAHAVPPNDGGIALGQAWIALQALAG